MSPLRLNGSTSGFSQLDAPAIAGDQTFTLPGTGGTIDRLNRAGNILQVVNATNSTQVSVTATAYTDTALTASITPSSSSSKILVIVSQNYTVYRVTGNGCIAGIRLLRDATAIYTPPTDGTGPYELGVEANGATMTSMFVYGRFALTVLDSPATTSSVTYKTQSRPYITGMAIQTSSVSSQSHITLLEVAA